MYKNDTLDINKLLQKTIPRYIYKQIYRIWKEALYG